MLHRHGLPQQGRSPQCRLLRLRRRGRGQIFSTCEIGRSGEGLAGRGTKEYTGGTGKYVGLTGRAEYMVSGLKTLDKNALDVFQEHVQGSYKLQPLMAKSVTQ